MEEAAGNGNRPSLWRTASTIPMEISIAEASAMFPGFRFSPTDEELIRFYLKKKLEGSDQDVEVIPEVDICRHEPWDLPAQSIIQSDNEWFFFSPRGKKYPNGSQSKRATDFGYWKATGKERLVKSGSTLIGTKRTLVFHTGRAPKGQRTEWIMHEYCTGEKSQDAMVVCRLRKNSEFHLNDNSRRNSDNREDHTTPLSGGAQSGMQDGPVFGDGFAKESSSSYNSHSVEQGDCESDCDGKDTDDFSQHRSNGKVHAEVEDCYADIMKDDIVKLDDSTQDGIPLIMPLSAVKLKTGNISEQPMQSSTLSVVPFQGTANRRIRMKKNRVKSFKFGEHSNAPGTSKPNDGSFFIDQFKITRSNIPFLFTFLVTMILLILCLVVTGSPLQHSNMKIYTSRIMTEESILVEGTRM